MANYLKVAMKETIVALLALGWSFRRIERETGIRRETISRYADEARAKPATPPTGSDQNRPGCPPAQPSLCFQYQAVIESKLQRGLDARRIHQDLQHEHGFQGSYDSVKRFCRKLKKTQPEVFARVEVEPGSQVQVDFVRGAPTLDPSTGKYRRPHLFHAVLCYSRHSYEEVVWRQDLATFIRCFENAFVAFGGCTEIVTIDNLKAGVTKACFYDPEINPVFAAFARHYGFAVLPTRPRTPRQNGKVERSHQYAESSALRGRRFETLEEQNLHLQWWNRNVARLRIHGTTKQQVWARFVDQEKGSLRSLPHERFSFFRSSTRKVSPDGHIELERAFYSVPHRYLGLELRVDWDDRVVRIYHEHEQVAFHPRTQAGTFQTEPGHLPVEKRYVHHRLESDLLARAERVGPDVSAWAQAALLARGVLAYRLLQGVLSLTRKHSAQTVNRACRIALDHQAFRYRTLVTLCKRQSPEQKPLFIQEHELIRPLSEYIELIEKGISDALP
jgi:transposase